MFLVFIDNYLLINNYWSLYLYVLNLALPFKNITFKYLPILQVPLPLKVIDLLMSTKIALSPVGGNCSYKSLQMKLYYYFKLFILVFIMEKFSNNGTNHCSFL